MKNATGNLYRRINQALAARPRVDVKDLREEEVFAGFTGTEYVTRPAVCVSSAASVAKDPFFSTQNQEVSPATSSHLDATTEGTSSEVASGGSKPVGRFVCGFCREDLGPSQTEQDSHGLCKGAECRRAFMGHVNSHVICYHTAYRRPEHVVVERFFLEGK